MHTAPAILLALSLLAPSITAAQKPQKGDSGLAAQMAACSGLFGGTPSARLGLTGADSNCAALFGLGLGGAGTSGAGNGQIMAAMAAMAKLNPAQQSQIQSMMARISALSPGIMAGAPPGMNLGGDAEAEEENPIGLSSDLVRDLKRGNTTLRNIGWEAGTGAVAPEGAASFERAMAQLAAAMKRVGGSYRLDLYMSQESPNVVVRTLGPKRLATIQSSLAKRGVTAQLGGIRKDGDPRLEIIRLQ